MRYRHFFYTIDLLPVVDGQVRTLPENNQPSINPQNRRRSIAHRRLKVSWKYFAFGMLIFLIFQVVSRVPIVTVLGQVLAPQLKASTAFLYTWLAILALTAGIFEEVGRYIGYRWFMRREEKTWNKAVMYGLGHGGLESILLVGGLVGYMGVTG